MKNVAILNANVHSDISAGLVKSCVDVLIENQLSFKEIEVPGALELPVALSWAADSGKYSGYVILGCVIKGDTDHYKVVIETASEQIGRIVVDRSLAVGFGVIAAYSREDACLCASENDKNYGRMAALAAVNMMRLREDILNNEVEQCSII